METKRAAETLSFEDAISETGRRRMRNAEGGAHRVYSYVERGFYAQQIRRLLQLFPPEQLLFLRTDDLWTRTQNALSRVCRFLNLASPASVETAYIVPVRSDGLGTISENALLKLNSLFEMDVNETSRLTGLSLADWMEPDYREPMAAN